MASPLTNIGRAPVWQVLAGGVLLCGVVAASWYFLYYEEAAQQLELAKTQHAAAETELKRVQTEFENFEQRRRELAEKEAQIAAELEELPSTEATVDHLMKPFQRQARLVGLELESWAPGAEQRFDYYSKTPIEIHASGTWHQTAEFFRKISEMPQKVGVEELRLQLVGGKEGQPRDLLRVDFTAASFRFLTDASLGQTGPTSRRTGAEAAEGAPAEGAPAGAPAPAPKEGG